MEHRAEKTTFRRKAPTTPTTTSGQPSGQREHDQFDLGNQFLRDIMLFLYVSIATRAPAIMEHPGTPANDRQVANSWLLLNWSTSYKHLPSTYLDRPVRCQDRSRVSRRPDGHALLASAAFYRRDGQHRPLQPRQWRATSTAHGKVRPPRPTRPKYVR